MGSNRVKLTLIFISHQIHIMGFDKRSSKVGWVGSSKYRIFQFPCFLWPYASSCSFHRLFAGVVPRRVVQEPRQELLQHPLDFRGRLLHLVQRAAAVGRHRGAPGRHDSANREGLEGGRRRVRRKSRLRREAEGNRFDKFCGLPPFDNLPFSIPCNPR